VADATVAEEEYLQTIFWLQEAGLPMTGANVAKAMQLSAPTVSEMLGRLERDGYVTRDADRAISFTPTGAGHAEGIVRRHRLIERWLTDVLGLDWAAADLEAAALSHGVSEVVLERLDEHLGRPSTCPHGNVIPGRRAPAGRPMQRLVHLPTGVESRVFRISEVAEHDAPHLLAVLHDGGLVPDARILLVERGDHQLRLIVEGHPAVLSDTVAAAVWVESAPD